MKILITEAGRGIGRHVVKFFIEVKHNIYSEDFAFYGSDEKTKRVDEPIF